MAKQVAITYIYPVMSTLKLKPSSAFNLAAYFCIKGNMISLLQNLAPMLTLLFFLTLALYNIIQIAWKREGSPTNLDPRRFMLRKKQTLLNALT